MYMWAVCAPEIHGKHWLVLVSCGLLIWSLISSFSRQSLSSVFPAVHALFEVIANVGALRKAQGSSTCEWQLLSWKVAVTPDVLCTCWPRPWPLPWFSVGPGSWAVFKSPSKMPAPAQGHEWGGARQVFRLRPSHGTRAPWHLAKDVDALGVSGYGDPFLPQQCQQYQHNINTISTIIQNPLKKPIQHHPTSSHIIQHHPTSDVSPRVVATIPRVPSVTRELEGEPHPKVVGAGASETRRPHRVASAETICGKSQLKYVVLTWYWHVWNMYEISRMS